MTTLLPTYSSFQTNVSEIANSRTVLSKDVYAMVQLVKPGGLRPYMYQLTFDAGTTGDRTLGVNAVTKEGQAITEEVSLYKGDQLFIPGTTKPITIGSKSTIPDTGIGTLNIFPLEEDVVAATQARSYAMIRIEGYKGGTFSTTANVAEQLLNDGRSYANKAPTTRDASLQLSFALLQGDDGYNLMSKYSEGLTELFLMIVTNPYQPFNNSRTYWTSAVSRYARCYFTGLQTETSTPEFANGTVDVAVVGQPKQPFPIDFDSSLLDPALFAQVADGTFDHYWNPPS